MTDKELRRLKRSELLELMFYLREELDKLKEENENLKERLDSLTKSSMETKPELPDDLISAIADAVRSTAGDFFSKSHHNNNSDSSKEVSEETEQ